MLPGAPLTHLCEICVFTLVTLSQHINQYTPFCEQSEEMIHSSGNVEGFQLCQCSERIQCIHCMRYSTRGMIYCACGACLLSLEQVRRLNKERIEIPTIPFFTIKKWRTHRGYRCGRSEWQAKVIPPSQIGFKKKQIRRNSRPSTIDSEIKNPIANLRWLLAGRKKPWTPLQRITTRMLRRLLNESDTTILSD